MKLARFPAFNSLLREKELQSLAASKITNGVFNDPKKQQGHYRLINVLDMFRGDSIDVTLLSSLDLDLAEFEKNQVKYGDIFFTRSSLVASGIAWSNVNLSDADNLTFDGHLMKLSIDLEQYDPRYIAQYCRAFPIRKQLMRRGKTGTMTTIGQSDIADVKFHIPCLLEQKKIADFLTSVDTRIQQLKQKQSLLQQYKKGLMQKLFSQTLRFKDDNGNSFPDWDEVEIGSVLGYEQPTKYIVKSTDYDDGYDVPVLTAGKSFILGYTNEVEGICNQLPVIIFDDFTTAYKYVDFEFKVKSSAMKILRVEDGSCDNRYVHYAMSTIKFPIGEHKRYWISEYQLMPIPKPSKEEQTKIANALAAMDKKIDLVAKQIEHTQTFKKGLLQQMFV